MGRYVCAPNRLRSRGFICGVRRAVLLAAVVLAAYHPLCFVPAASDQILVATRASRADTHSVQRASKGFTSVSHRRGWRIGLRGVGLAELPDVASGEPLSSSVLQHKVGLRLPLPNRVALQFKGSDSSPQLLEANLRSAEGKRMMIEVLGVASNSLVELQEADAEGDETAWHVCSSKLSSLSEGTRVTLHDTTPSVEAPSTAAGADGMKHLCLQSSDAEPGNLAYNCVGGLQREGHPRDVDGINCSFTVWSCTEAMGSCKVVEDGVDAKALICEFGPRGIKEGLKSMLPGETRRFWIPAEVKDRRFGRPEPDRYLPGGSLVVDLTLHSIDRESVFTYKMSTEAKELIQQRERHPLKILIRGIGVGIQFLPFLWYIQQHPQQAVGDTLQGLAGDTLQVLM